VDNYAKHHEATRGEGNPKKKCTARERPRVKQIAEVVKTD